MSAEPGPVIGRSVARNEDERLLRGRGQYVDDVRAPDALHVAFLRSPVAHARIRRLDVSAARAHPGVTAVWTHADLGERAEPLPLLFPHEHLPYPKTQHPLAIEEVDFVGQPIAMVIAASRYVAEDAAELIELELDELPAVVDYEAAVDGGPLVHADLPTNVAADGTWTVGDPDRAFAEAEIVVRHRFVCERSASMPLEPRAVLARFEPGTDALTVWDTTQCVLPVRSALIAKLGLPEDRVHVIAQDVGGGFGLKGYLLYPEELLVPLAALRLRCAVRWTEDRREHFLASNHQRGQVHTIELAATRDGVITGLRDDLVQDQGAFIAYGLVTPWIAASHVAGAYRIPNLAVRYRCVYTNKVSVSPMRSVGRPQSSFALERAVDLLARELGIDRAELRRRNLLSPEELPYARDGLFFAGYPVVLDSGDYPRALETALEAIGYEGFAAEQARARADGRYLGLGLACYVEGTGEGPYEGARVYVQPTSGRVQVTTGLTSQGQSHATTFAQVAADVLGLEPADVQVEEGNTSAFGFGAGTFGSRAIVNCANAVALAAEEVREQALRHAANMLEAAVEDLELAGGRVEVRGAPERAVTLREIAIAVNPIRYTTLDPSTAAVARFAPARARAGFERGDGPLLEGSAYWAPSSTTWTNGVHAAIVEVDPETGAVRYLRYVVVHDCGVMVNPAIVRGQIHGGVAQGVANAFYERMVYDEAGQHRNASLLDFLMPYATEVPAVEIHHLETPSPLNPLGIKGTGEAGSISPPAVTAAAIEDALAPFGVHVDEAPLDPQRVRQLIAAAAGRAP
ncbi:MAG: xanthine dehydrogenase family protein [Thermoleophilia bacterium]|nr:xanthine dehydrogenase family protein [Thermoleophilia bacterium]